MTANEEVIGYYNNGIKLTGIISSLLQYLSICIGASIIVAFITVGLCKLSRKSNKSIVSIFKFNPYPPNNIKQIDTKGDGVCLWGTTYLMAVSLCNSSTLSKPLYGSKVCVDCVLWPSGLERWAHALVFLISRVWVWSPCCDTSVLKQGTRPLLFRP